MQGEGGRSCWVQSSIQVNKLNTCKETAQGCSRSATMTTVSSCAVAPECCEGSFVNRGAHVDYAVTAFRRMRKLTKGDWAGSHPKTNVMWMLYLAELLLSSDKPITGEEAGSACALCNRTVLLYDHGGRGVTRSCDACAFMLGLIHAMPCCLLQPCHRHHYTV